MGIENRSDSQRRYGLLVGGLALAVLWLGFAQLIVPRLIESAYRGDSFSFLNSRIHGQEFYPVDFYLQLWTRISWRVLLSCATFIVLAIVMTSEVFYRRCVGDATPGMLGGIRMWTCAVLLITTLWDDLGSIGLLPLEYHADMGLMRLLHALPIGFDTFLTTPSDLRWFQRVTEVLLFFGMIGLRTRLVIPLCAFSTFVMNGILREYTGFWHQNLVPIYMLIVLSFMPAGDGWSVDRLWRIRQGRPVPDAERGTPLYGWARYLCWVPIAITYSSAGFSKLRASGLEWMSASNMKALLFEQTLYPRAGNYSISLRLASAPDVVFVILAIAALCGEAFFITVLFSRVCRRLVPAAMILMHIGIVFLMDIVFLDLTLILLVFYDFGAVGRRLGAWVRERRPMPVLSDPGSGVRLHRFAWGSGIAVAAVIAIQTFFWSNKIEFYPFTSVQMFTRPPGTVVTYYKTLGHWQSGRVGPIFLEDTIGVMSINSRYEGLFDLCFSQAERLALCRKTVSILGSAYNDKVHADGDVLTQLEIQRWKWDFGAHPQDPAYGDIDATFIGDVGTGQSRRSALGGPPSSHQ